MKAITTKYLPATNTKGARIVASEPDGRRVTIPYPYELSGDHCYTKAAQALCEKLNWGGRLHTGWLKPGVCVHVFED